MVENNYLKNLDKKYAQIVEQIGQEANKCSLSAYLVGGVVRDLILTRPNVDLDVVIEGSAIELGRRLAKVFNMDVKDYPQFMTITLIKEIEFHVDIASARREFYPQSGALPVVEAGNLQADLFRRDFTINAIALSLNRENFGQIVDTYGGLEDIKKRKIRVLHRRSFWDDPTRLLRAIRFEQRFDFSLSEETSELFQEAVKSNCYLTVKAPRYFVEFKKILMEDEPVKTLKRLQQLKALKLSKQTLKLNVQEVNKLNKELQTFGKKYYKDYPQRWLLYMMSLTGAIVSSKLSLLLESIQIRKEDAQAILASKQKDGIVRKLALKALKKSDICRILNEFSSDTIFYFHIFAKQKLVQKRIELYLTQLKGISLSVNGEDIKRLGVRQGSKVGVILNELLNRKIDKSLRGRPQELKIAKEIINSTRKSAKWDD